MEAQNVGREVLPDRGDNMYGSIRTGDDRGRIGGGLAYPDVGRVDLMPGGIVGGVGQNVFQPGGNLVGPTHPSFSPLGGGLGPGMGGFGGIGRGVRFDPIGPPGMFGEYGNFGSGIGGFAGNPGFGGPGRRQFPDNDHLRPPSGRGDDMFL